MERSVIWQKWRARWAAWVPSGTMEAALTLWRSHAVKDWRTAPGRIRAAVSDGAPVWRVEWTVRRWDASEWDRAMTVLREHADRGSEQIWVAWDTAGLMWSTPGNRWRGTCTCRQGAFPCSHAMAVMYAAWDGWLSAPESFVEFMTPDQPVSSLAESFYRQLKPPAAFGQNGDRTMEDLRRLVAEVQRRARQDRVESAFRHKH